jgi:hypothetical protein
LQYGNAIQTGVKGLFPAHTRIPRRRRRAATLPMPGAPASSSSAGAVGVAARHFNCSIPIDHSRDSRRSDGRRCKEWRRGASVHILPHRRMNRPAPARYRPVVGSRLIQGLHRLQELCRRAPAHRNPVLHSPALHSPVPRMRDPVPRKAALRYQDQVPHKREHSRYRLLRAPRRQTAARPPKPVTTIEPRLQTPVIRISR